MSEAKKDFVLVPVLLESPSEFSKREIAVNDEQYMIDAVVDRMMGSGSDRHLIYYFVQGLPE